MATEDQRLVFGRTTYRQTDRPFHILAADRHAHIHVVGKTGVGKSSFIEALAGQDLAAESGFALIDAHGDLAEAVVGAASPSDKQRITYLNAPDTSQPFGYNPLRQVRDEKIPLAASGLLDTFRKLWPDAWGVRMEHVLRASLYTLLEGPGTRLPDILRLYVDDEFRRAVTSRVRNHVVRRFWIDEFEKY